ncbi:MAG: hypothetical protein KME17_03790 [Cyanosarcina radialis HA8281-LM2]|nr:hypothetical protein [Cyanosarcina radialis HA8281-LM2]
MGRGGEGKMGRWGDGEMGSKGNKLCPMPYALCPFPIQIDSQNRER